MSAPERELRARGADLSTAMLRSALELVEISSVSRSEAALASHVEAALAQHRCLFVERVGDNVIARSSFGRSHRVVVAGHLDTVPPFDASGGRIEGATLWGLGAVDMKGGLAVMLSLPEMLERAAVDVTFVFYVCEEIERSANGLLHLRTHRPELLAADAAILLEPTGGSIEAGCQGTMRLEITLGGRRAHTARPHMGMNAVHRLADVLHVVGGYRPRSVVMDGCTYTEQLQAVAVHGGVANNVVPDRATLTVNHRFAPDRPPVRAESELVSMLRPALDEALGDRVELKDCAAGAAPDLGDPLLARLVEATGREPRAKLGWTDVATFAELAIPATNFGPGDPLLAHTADEHVSGDELVETHDVLERFLTSPLRPE